MSNEKIFTISCVEIFIDSKILLRRTLCKLLWRFNAETRLKAAFRLLLPLVKTGPVNGVRIVTYQIFSESFIYRRYNRHQNSELAVFPGRNKCVPLTHTAVQWMTSYINQYFVLTIFYKETISLPVFFAGPKMCEYVGLTATIYYVGHSLPGLPGWDGILGHTVRSARSALQLTRRLSARVCSS